MCIHVTFSKAQKLNFFTLWMFTIITADRVSEWYTQFPLADLARVQMMHPEISGHQIRLQITISRDNQDRKVSYYLLQWILLKSSFSISSLFCSQQNNFSLKGFITLIKWYTVNKLLCSWRLHMNIVFLITTKTT